MTRITIKALGLATLFAGFGLEAKALPPQPKVEDMASVQPKQQGVDVTVLTPADLAKCRVEPFPNAQQPVGFVLLDSKNQPVRRFVAVNTPNFNILSFYSDGEEVYRETDSKGSGKIDQFRWLGSNGSKIGRDLDGNGTIDVWDAISPEEVSKELFEAIVNKDQARLKALQPTEAELKALGLSAAEIGRVQAKIGAASARLGQAVAGTAMTNKAKWIHSEFFLPETTPADAFGGTQDIVRHRNGTVLFERGDGKNADFFQTGELLRIGNAWRVLEGPVPGQAQPPMKGSPNAGPDVPDSVKPLVDKLIAIKDGPTANKDRVAILEQIVASLNGNPAQDSWMRQMLETYASMGEGGDTAAIKRLNEWRDQIEKHAAKTPIAGFVTFRAHSVDYLVRLKAADTQVKSAEVQKWWREALEAWLTNYPGVDETPEALYRLAMAYEFKDKAGEATAINHYTTLTKNFPNHPLAQQAAGAASRLSSEGKPFGIVNCTEVATGKPFDTSRLAGKVVIVYYWGSFTAPAKLKQDAEFLNELLKKNAGKVELVTITLDGSPQQAVGTINATQLPGTHLYSANSAMATAWGIMGQHIFLLDKSGKVDNKNASIPQIADEVEKLTK